MKNLISTAKKAIKRLGSEYELEKSLIRRLINEIESGDKNSAEALKTILHSCNELLDQTLFEELEMIINN